MGKFEEQFKLNLKFISSNKRLAIITIIGLSISIAMVSQNIIFLNNFRNTAFDEFSTTTSNINIDAQLDKVIIGDAFLEDRLTQNTRNELEDSYIDLGFLSHQSWITFRFFYLLLENNVTSLTEFHDTFVVGVNQSFLELLDPIITEGIIPGQGEYCIVTDTSTIQNTNLEIDTGFDAYVQLDEQATARDSFDAGLIEAGKTLNFTSIINMDNVIYGSIPLPGELTTLVNLVLGLGKNLILTNFNNLPNLVQSIPQSNMEYSILGRITFNLEEFDVFRLDEHIRSLQIFTNNLQESLISIVSEEGDTAQNRIELTLYPWIIPLLNGFRQEYRIFQIFLMAFMLPTLGMSLTLTAFASNQVKKQRDLHINTYHQRGASRKMLFSFMIFELIIFSLIAVIIGFLIGWPYTLVALRSDNFFSFAKEASIPTNISALVIGICLGVGFGIAWLSNVFSLWRKTKISVEEALQERVEKKPFWERFYVDIFLLVVGVLMFVTSINQIGSSTNIALEFAFYFAAPAPILIMIGGIMLITRIYPYFIQGFSNLLFRVPKLELSAVSAKNAIRRKGSTTRTIILMSLTFALTVASMIIPDSYQSYDLEDAYYNLGADIVVEGVDVTTPNFKDYLKDIEGIETSSYISVLDVEPPSEGGLSYNIKILGVELDNYSKVAYEENEYTNGRGIASLLSSIVNETDVIAQTDQVNHLNLNENMTFTFRNFVVEDTLVYKHYTVDIVEMFDFWPTLYDNVPQTGDQEIDIGLIGNLSLPYLIATYDYEVDGKLIIKVAEGYNIADVAREIEIYSRYDVVNVINLILISEGSLKATVLFGALNSSFIVSILISSATLITMMIVQGIEREREIALLKSFGINTRQLFSFFISEAIIILLFTMIVGSSLGIGTSVMLMRVLRIGANIPNHEMVYPVVKIIWTTLAIFGSGLISTIIPILVNTRKKISGAMRTV